MEPLTPVLVWGVGNLVLTMGGPPSDEFWRLSRKYLVEISIVDG